MGISQRVRAAFTAPELTAALSIPAATTPAAITYGPRSISSPFEGGTLASVQLALSDLFGQQYADALPLTRAEAMSVPAMARARNLICSTVASVAGGGDHGHQRDTWADVTQPAWIGRTDSALPPYHRMVWTVDDCLFTGYSLWRLVRATDKRTVLAADRIERGRWDFDADGRVLVDGKPAAAAGYPDLLLIIGPHEGLLTYAKRTLRHASHLLRAAERAAETPSANLELHQVSDDELDDAEISELVTSWVRARLGLNGGVAYTNRHIEVKEHGTFDAHLLTEGRNAAAVDVARVANLPASLLDAGSEGSSITYQTVRDNAQQLVDQGVGMFMAAISGSLSSDVMTAPGEFVAFDLETWLSQNNPAPLAADPAARGGAPTPPTTEDTTA